MVTLQGPPQQGYTQQSTAQQGVTQQGPSPPMVTLQGPPQHGYTQKKYSSTRCNPIRSESSYDNITQTSSTMLYPKM